MTNKRFDYYNTVVNNFVNACVCAGYEESWQGVKTQANVLSEITTISTTVSKSLVTDVDILYSILSPCDIDWYRTCTIPLVIL